MTVAELIEKLQALPQTEQVYRWDSDRQEDGSETVLVMIAGYEMVELYYEDQPPCVLRVVIS